MIDGIDAAVAIDELHVGIGEDMLGAVAADAGGLDQHVLGLAAIGAGIHAQRAADGAGNAEEEFQAADIGRCRGLRHALVERGGAGADDVASALVSPNARGDSRITTPGMPPSRTIRLEPTPTT